MLSTRALTFTLKSAEQGAVYFNVKIKEENVHLFLKENNEHTKIYSSQRQPYFTFLSTVPFTIHSIVHSAPKFKFIITAKFITNYIKMYQL